ncbi:hypothetical protein Ait01nite_079430 [Actinoplanes italicus]|uniref:hypothetical protein n=1 Tax=Actinoplanes italicus TaxID=113567 RepID=UPI000D0586EB|nr:hypothetical protein [Actinoplanes italicus]GIE34898.1 hypothetical protein Ait01nite_079430 [Actinoplanes italicus]
MESLGVVAHRGGLVVERPELTVGIVRAVSRPDGLELELLARRPLDRRDAVQRQADIRAGVTGPPPAPRRLLPEYDEGLDLRVGWLDADGRAHWEYGSWSSSSGDHFEGVEGPSFRTLIRFPPMFDRVSVALAWPEIGFPETVLELPLPDRATVERETVSIWEAPLRVRHPRVALNHRDGTHPVETPAVEAGRIAAAPQVLSRGGEAVVVLTSLTAAGRYLYLGVCSIAEGEQGETAAAEAFPPGPEPARPGASIAVVTGQEAVWVPTFSGSAGGGDRSFRSEGEFVVARPDTDVLTLLVTWPSAGLAEVLVDVPLTTA